MMLDLLVPFPLIQLLLGSWGLVHPLCHSNVTITCSWPNRTCRPRGNNCHQSANPINVTSHYHTRGRYPDCSYSTTPQNKFYVVAWDPHQPGYSPNCLTPVGLD
ncbi:ribonuclease K3-like [Mustela putorius furo]|uniref:Ribonuclease K3-like n=1 Tax=Mustela putorius furo TaxID=9669 RepID=A0A8U0TB73_MUSPF|nr:ribonuclease K3-like [Mustela putorius furo]